MLMASWHAYQLSLVQHKTREVLSFLKLTGSQKLTSNTPHISEMVSFKNKNVLPREFASRSYML